MPWEAERIVQQVQQILDALEVSAIQPEARRYLQRVLFRSEYLAKHFRSKDDGAGRVTLLIRTIMESEGNQDALVEPIVSAVCGAMRPEWTQLGLKWIEAFDQIPLTAILQTMRGLDLFSEKSIGHYYGIALRNKLAAILEPADAIGVRKRRAAVKSGRPRPPIDQPAQRMAA